MTCTFQYAALLDILTLISNQFYLTITINSLELINIIHLSMNANGISKLGIFIWILSHILGKTYEPANVNFILSLGEQ